MTTEKDKEHSTRNDDGCMASRCEEGDEYNNDTHPSWGERKQQLWTHGIGYAISKTLLSKKKIKKMKIIKKLQTSMRNASSYHL